MAKKAKTRSEGGVTKFSIKTLHSEIDNAVERLKGVQRSRAKTALLLKLKTIRLIADCGPDMSFDL